MPSLTRTQWLLLGLGGAAIAYLIYNRQTVQSLTDSGVDTVTATLSGWQTVQQGPVWVPQINAVEQQYNLPPNLLARIAYQESHFRPDIISGATVSSAGALGLMQLEPEYFQTVQRPVPFSDQDTLDQINEAAHLLANLYRHYQDWGLAIAAYNDGQGDIDKYLAGKHTLPPQTVNYITQVMADVPVASAAFSA